MVAIPKTKVVLNRKVPRLGLAVIKWGMEANSLLSDNSPR